MPARSLFTELCADVLTYKPITTEAVEAIKVVEGICRELERTLWTCRSKADYTAWQAAIEDAAAKLAPFLPETTETMIQALDALSAARMCGMRALGATCPVATPADWRDDANKAIRDLQIAVTRDIALRGRKT